MLRMWRTYMHASLSLESIQQWAVASAIQPSGGSCPRSTLRASGNSAKQCALIQKIDNKIRQLSGVGFLVSWPRLYVTLASIWLRARATTSVSAESVCWNSLRMPSAALSGSGVSHLRQCMHAAHMHGYTIGAWVARANTTHRDCPPDMKYCKLTK